LILGEQILLASWLTHEEFRSKAAVLNAGMPAYQFVRTHTKVPPARIESAERAAGEGKNMGSGEKRIEIARPLAGAGQLNFSIGDGGITSALLLTDF
jgi:hypothetical protein